MTNLTALDFSIILVYMVMVLVIGSVVGLFVRNIKDYFAGGSSIPWYLGAISSYMTMMSTYVFVASAGIAYTEGIVAIVILWSAFRRLLLRRFFFRNDGNVQESLRQSNISKHGLTVPFGRFLRGAVLHSELSTT